MKWLIINHYSNTTINWSKKWLKSNNKKIYSIIINKIKIQIHNIPQKATNNLLSGTFPISSLKIMSKINKIKWTKISTKILISLLINYLKIKDLSHNNTLSNNPHIKTIKSLIWKIPHHFNAVSPKHAKNSTVPIQN